MKNKTQDKIVPEQEVGDRSGAEAEVNCRTREEALRVFHVARVRLLSVNKWHEYSGMLSGVFQLTDSNGTPLDRAPRLNDLIRIDLPGPGPRSGKGYDWVSIEAMENKNNPEQDEETFAFRVRPAAGPASGGKQSDHFYTPDATSSFIIQRKGRRVRAIEEGRNEVPNTDTGNVLDKVRNAVVAFTASKGMSYPQWKSLMKGILSTGNK